MRCAPSGETGSEATTMKFERELPKPPVRSLTYSEELLQAILLELHDLNDKSSRPVELEQVVVLDRKFFR